MTDHDLVPGHHQHSLHPYVSDHALAAHAALPQGGWTEFDGTLAFYDVSGFTRLTERLARLGRPGAEHINDVLNTIFERLIDEVFRVGGDVLEFGGDAMVVLYDGPEHELRAAIATARMFEFMAGDGLLETPAGSARLRMSCGMATGRQAYHLTGVSRRALIVAGPVSTEMARLEAAANAGVALVDAELAAALPRGWITTAKDGRKRLRLDRIRSETDLRPSPRPTADDASVAALLPQQFHSLVDARHRAGELKQVAMAFVRLDRTDDLLTHAGVDALHHRLSEISAIVDDAAAELDVCWLETQAEANSVRWTLIAGATTASERDGERLLRVLRRISERTPAALRIGANRGVVYVGDMGHPSRCTFIAMGDATNLAARLMGKAHPGEIIAGERLHDTCPGRFVSTALEPFRVKGKKEPVRAFVVGPLVERHDAARDDADAAVLVGRDAELEALRSIVATGDTVEIVGDVGLGKTRLWSQLRDADGARRWLVMRSEPHEVESPFLPIRRLIRSLAGITARDDPAAAGSALTAIVLRSSKELLPWLPLVADVAGATVASTPQVDALDPQFRGDRLRTIVAELLVAIAGRDGVIVLEDAHWLDESSRHVVDAVCALPDRGVAVIVTRRAGDPVVDTGTTIELGPLDDDVATGLLLSVLPPSVASDATVARLRGLGGGNPLYLLELAKIAIRSGSTGGADTSYPDTIEQLLVARIDQLPISGRELIRDLSVLGSPINRTLASRVLGRPDLEQAGVWEEALGDLVVLADDEVDFRNELVRLAAYEGLALRRRRAIHERAGDVIEAWGESAPITDTVSALAFHASGSGLPDRIARWCRTAAEDAIDKGAVEIAESLLEDVVAAHRRLSGAVPERIAALRRLAFAAERAGHADRALEALRDASRLADEAERALIAVDRARLLEKLGRYRAALTLTARALSSDPDPATAAHLRIARATIHNFRGQFATSLELCDSVLGDRHARKDRRLVAQAHLLAEWCCASLGRPERAAHEDAALELLTELDDSIGLANLYLNRGTSAWLESRVDDAIADLNRSSRYYLRAGDVVGAALCDNNVAEILTLQHRLDEAEPLLTNARRVLRAASYPLGTAITTSGMSRVMAWRGHHAEALDLQGAALDRFRELGADDYVVESLVRLVEIHVLTAEAAAAAATNAASEARTALERLGDVPVLPATLRRLEARARRLAGDVAGSRSLLDEAQEIAARDGSDYEAALATLAIARADGDDERLTTALAQLTELGVASPPPGC